MKKKSILKFWGIVGVGLLIRIIYAFWVQDAWMNEDAGGYFQDALWMLEGKEISPFWPPGIPYFLAAWMSLTGPSPTWAMMGMLLWYLAFCGAFAVVAHHWLQEKSVRILLLMFAVYPAFIHHSVAPLSHLPVAVCLLVCLLLILRMRRLPLPLFAQVLHLVGMGVLLGVMGLFRPGSLSVIPVLIVGSFLLFRPTVRFAWVRAMLPLLFTGLILGVWEYSLYQKQQRWVGINDATSMNIFIGNNPHTPLYKTWWLGSHDETHNPVYREFYETRDQIRSLPMAEQKSAFSQQAWQHIQDQPGLFVLRSLNRLRCFFAFDTYTGARAFRTSRWLGVLFLLLDVFCYFLLGYLTITSWKGSNISSFDSSLLVWIIIAYSIPYLLAFSHPTYHFAILPIMGLLAGRGLEDRTQFNNWSLHQKVGIAIFVLIQLEWVVFMVS